MNVSFHLYFPKEADARKAADLLKTDGFEVETRLGADNVNWLTLGSASVDDKQFDAVEAKVQSLANSLGGKLDGFEEEG